MQIYSSYGSKEKEPWGEQERQNEKSKKEQEASDQKCVNTKEKYRIIIKHTRKAVGLLHGAFWPKRSCLCVNTVEAHTRRCVPRSQRTGVYSSENSLSACVDLCVGSGAGIIAMLLCRLVPESRVVPLGDESPQSL